MSCRRRYRCRHHSRTSACHHLTSGVGGTRSVVATAYTEADIASMLQQHRAAEAAASSSSSSSDAGDARQRTLCNACT